MCFGSSSSDSSEKIVKQQEEEAKKAREKEEKRQKRIAQGLANIKAAFHGGKTKTTTKGKYDWSKFNPTTSGADAGGGYTYYYKANDTSSGSKSSTSSTGYTGKGTQQRNSDNYTMTTTGGSNRGTGNSASQNRSSGTSSSSSKSSGSSSSGSGGSSGGTWYLMDSYGNLYAQGSDVDTETTTESDNTGFDDAYYQKYKDSIINYYMPQVAEQYQDAQDETTYRLARAGTLRSSTAAEETADLSGQNERNQAKVRSDADSAAAKQKERVAQEEQNAVNTLYASEDPEVATSQATSAVANVSSDEADLSPLGAVFDIATIGTAGYLKGAANAYATNNAKKYGGSSDKYGSTSVVGTG
jgi:hypothetical protein